MTKLKNSEAAEGIFQLFDCLHHRYNGRRYRLIASNCRNEERVAAWKVVGLTSYMVTNILAF